MPGQPPVLALNAKPNYKKMINPPFYKNPKNIAIIMAMFFIIDRVLKYFAVRNLLPKISFGGIFKLSFTPNSFISFSFPFSGTPLIITICLIMLALISYIIYLIIKKKSETREVVLLTTILFGAINNLTDRINYGFVIDYLEIKNFTVFNLADVMICFGAISIITSNFFNKKTKNGKNFPS